MTNGPSTADHRLTKPRRHTDAHRKHIADVLRDYPGAQAGGFETAMHALHKEACGRSFGEMASPGFRPDAFRINRETSEIELYEVEITSALTDRKVIDMGMFWFEWDCEDCPWIPVLIVVDRYGHRNRIDLMHAYYRDGPFDHVRPKYGELAA